MVEQRNRLDLSKTIRLTDWIRANRDFVEKNTVEQIAPRAAGELGFAILPSNVKTAADAVDIFAKSNRKRRDSGSTQKDLTVIAESIVQLYRLTGNNPPQKLVAVAQMLPLE